MTSRTLSPPRTFLLACGVPRTSEDPSTLVQEDDDMEEADDDMDEDQAASGEQKVNLVSWCSCVARSQPATL